jgi:hypothetical protein
LEEQVGATSIHGQVAEFVDHQKIEPSQLVEKFAERVRRVRGEQLVEQIRCVGKQDAAPRSAGVDRQRNAEVRLPHTRPTYKQDVDGLIEERQAGQLAHAGGREAWLKAEVELLQCAQELGSVREQCGR